MTEWRKKLNVIKSLEKLKTTGDSLLDESSHNGLKEFILFRPTLVDTEKFLDYCQYYKEVKDDIQSTIINDSFIDDRLDEFPRISYKVSDHKIRFISNFLNHIKVRKFIRKVTRVSELSNSIINYIWGIIGLSGSFTEGIRPKSLEIPDEVLSSTRQKLVVRNIEKTYKKRKVVKGVSFYMTEGEVIGLLGPNGAGKTTSFYMVVGLVFPESGGIFLDNLEITHFPMYQRSKLGIGYLAQEASVFRKLSVEDNIMAILEIQDISRDEKNARLEELLVELDITHIRRSYGFQLSGGERRRTEIARALASNPSFLLLDEPFAGVDPIAVQEIQRIIVKLKAKGIGVLITDHNARETLKITDRSYILADGLIRYYGTARELAENDEVKKVYLGDEFTL